VNDSQLEGLLAEKLAESRGSNSVASVEAAMILHRLNGADGADVNRERVLALVKRALQSEDAELLVEVGEALLAGIYLPNDELLANRFYTLAYERNPMLGAYALGRMFFNNDNVLARRYFKVSASLGHFASQAYLAKLNIAATKYFWRVALALYVPLGICRLFRALLSKDTAARMWRYKDPIKSKRSISIVDARIGNDRRNFFQTIQLVLDREKAGSG
jgi:TPR repeat protein